LKSLEKIRHIISSICLTQRAVLAAYVFGSVAKKDNRKPGDIDIAVLLDDKYSQSFSVLSFISTLEKTIGNRVDLVVLNRAGEVLKYEVHVRNLRFIAARHTKIFYIYTKDM